MRIVKLLLTILLLGYPCSAGADPGSTITFANQSGDLALVKLVGPSRQAVDVPSGTTRTVKVSAGSYYLLVRYGAKPGSYRYSKGQSFDVEEKQTALSSEYSRISITLHKVVGGNYSSAPSSREEFEGQEVLEDLMPQPLMVNFNECKDRFVHFATSIYIGKRGTEDDLIKDFDKDRFPEIALLFLCSGNTKLAKHGREWLAVNKPDTPRSCSELYLSSYICSQGYKSYPLLSKTGQG